MEIKKNSQGYSTMQLSILVILRIGIGWHLLYEGISKLFTPGWSSATYLDLSRWIFGGFFNWIGSTPAVLKVVDFLNIWGLILIGLGLMFGLFTRIASISGIFLLLLYYLAHPPLIGFGFGIPVEGHYLVVDKTLIEIFALCVLAYFPTSGIIGLDRIVNLVKNTKQKLTQANSKTEKPEDKSEDVHRRDFNRREIIKSLAALPVFGAFVYAVLKKQGWVSYEKKYLQDNLDAITSATIKTFNFSSLDELKGKVPQAQISGVNFSRVILGGNLIGGWAHARDLIYVSSLVKKYHTDQKVFETFMLAEKCGINAILTNPQLCRVINKYWRHKLGKIQFISDCGGKDLLTMVKKSIDNGATACYVQGGIADNLVKQGKIDEIAKALVIIKQNGLPAGIGAHVLETVTACVEYGLKPDFWMKTLHHINYWSAKPEQQMDNIWCTDPEETIQYMKSLGQPWIAFKTLGAGAIHPNVGFQYAFKNGADFICVGMYDFQIVEDVNIALDALANIVERERPWRA